MLPPLNKSLLENPPKKDQSLGARSIESYDAGTTSARVREYCVQQQQPPAPYWHTGVSLDLPLLGGGGVVFPIVGVARVADRKRRLCSSQHVCCHHRHCVLSPFCCHPRPQHGHRPRGLGLASPRTWHRQLRRQSVITDREGQFYFKITS